jgi:uncharacterized protein (TIGR02266 family)
LKASKQNKPAAAAEPSSSAERRKYPRLQLSVDVKFDSGHYFYGGRTRDVSEGGLFIESDVRLPPGTKLTVDLQVFGMVAPLEAEVMWVLIAQDGEAEGFGVRFTSLTAVQQSLLQAFVRDHEQGGMEMLDAEPEVVQPGKKGPPPLPRS